MADPIKVSGIYVANTAFSTDLDGAAVNVSRGERVRAGHPLVVSNPQYFDDVEVSVHYDVEDASATPGVQRSAPVAVAAVAPSDDVLRERARALNVPGRNAMSGDQLVKAVVAAEQVAKAKPAAKAGKGK